MQPKIVNGVYWKVHFNYSKHSTQKWQVQISQGLPTSFKHHDRPFAQQQYSIALHSLPLQITFPCITSSPLAMHKPIFCYDQVHVLHYTKIFQKGINAFNVHHQTRVCLRVAQILEITLYERDWQLYYEGLVLRDNYGDAFDRNLATEKPEQERRN
jgi:hypothetical protein